MDLWIKIIIVLIIATLVYREILKSTIRKSQQFSPTKRNATVLSLIGVGFSVGAFTYVGMSISLVETQDLRPFNSSRVTYHSDSIFDKGVIDVNGMAIKTNLSQRGVLAPLADELTQGCSGSDGCEAEKLFEYVTHIPYRTDYTSRSPKQVIETNWGDCDDKSNLFASLLNEKGIDYRFVYVPHHVFVVVHIEDKRVLPFLYAKLRIDGRDYYYAETTAKGASIGTFNGKFPYSFEGIYDIVDNRNIDLSSVKFKML
jgi:hypothetical protein